MRDSWIPEDLWTDRLQERISIMIEARVAWMVRVGDNCHVRCLQYFEVLEPKSGPVLAFNRGPAIKYNRWLAQPQGLPLVEAPEAEAR